MKKTMIAMAFMALTAAFGASAQTPAGNCANRQDCPANAKECCANAQQQCDRPCPQARACEFEGLNLTDAQKEQIKALKSEQVSKRQAERDANKAKKADRKQSRLDERKAYLAKVKAVLTPEQYVQYLENIALQTGKDIKRDVKKADRRQGPAKGPRGPRPAAPQAPANQAK